MQDQTQVVLQVVAASSPGSHLRATCTAMVGTVRFPNIALYQKPGGEPWVTIPNFCAMEIDDFPVFLGLPDDLKKLVANGVIAIGERYGLLDKNPPKP